MDTANHTRRMPPTKNYATPDHFITAARRGWKRVQRNGSEAVRWTIVAIGKDGKTIFSKRIHGEPSDALQRRGLAIAIRDARNMVRTAAAIGKPR